MKNLHKFLNESNKSSRKMLLQVIIKAGTEANKREENWKYTKFLDFIHSLTTVDYEIIEHKNAESKFPEATLSINRKYMYDFIEDLVNNSDYIIEIHNDSYVKGDVEIMIGRNI